MEYKGIMKRLSNLIEASNEELQEAEKHEKDSPLAMLMVDVTKDKLDFLKSIKEIITIKNGNPGLDGLLDATIDKDWIKTGIAEMASEMVEEAIEKTEAFYKNQMRKWLEMLHKDGCNSKSKVAEEIEVMLE